MFVSSILNKFITNGIEKVVSTEISQEFLNLRIGAVAHLLI